MANENAGGIYYEVGADVADLLTGANQAKKAFDDIGSAAYKTSSKLDAVDKSSQSAGKAVARAGNDASQAAKLIERLGNEIAILEEAQKSGAASAASLSAQLALGAEASDKQKQEAGALATKLYEMKAAQAAAAQASSDQAKAAAQAANEQQRAAEQQARATSRAAAQQASDQAKVRASASSLRQQIAVLNEEQQNGARSAAMLSARLQAGSAATAAQRREIGELAGKLYDLKNAQDQSARSSSGLKTGLSAIAAAISIGQIVNYAKAFLTTADAMTQLQARIDRLVPSAEQGRATFQAISMIASQTGASLQDTAKLWETLTSALKGTGATNGQLLALTDTLQKIGRIGGSSSEEMANALRQFGQSISSGTIRAEEFNSIIEQMPELARQIAAGLGITAGNAIGELRKRMLEGKLTAEDALNAIMKQTGSVNTEFEKLPRTVGQATNSMNIAFADLVKSINDATGASGLMVRVIDDLAATIDRMAGKAETASQKMQDLTSNGEMYARRAKTWAAIGLDGWSAQAQGISVVSNKAAMLIGDLDKVTKANAEATKPIKVSGTGDTKEVQKLEKTTKRKLELSKLEGEARARLQAQYDAEDAGITDSATIKKLQDESAETARNTEERKKNNSETKKGQSQAESAAAALDKLKAKAALMGDTTKELSREQAILTAQQSLGKGATQEQIKLAGEYAAQAYDTAAALRASAEADKARLQLAGKFDQIQKTAKPSMAADNQFKEQMLTIEQYKMAYPQKIAEAEAARAAIEKQYREQRVGLMWAEWKQQTEAAKLFGTAFDESLNTVSSSITGVLNGTQSLNDAIYNVANTVLSSLVNSFVQMGADWVRSAVMGSAAQTSAIATTTAASVAGTATTTAASTAAAGTTMAAWLPAALVASIGSFGAAAVVGGAALLAAFGLVAGLSGKRKNGGPVTTGGMYQVGEGGMPEIYQASNGRQYMIPGDNGSVISNRDLMSGGGQSSGGLVVYNNITNNSSANVSSSAQQNADGSLTISTFVSDMNEGGPMSQSIAANFATQRKATE